MELIADGLLIATAMTAGLYCLVLSRRLRRLTESGNGIGPQIEALDQALEDTRAALAETHEGVAELRGSTEAVIAQLARETARGEDMAEAIARGVEEAKATMQRLYEAGDRIEAYENRSMEAKLAADGDPDPPPDNDGGDDPPLEWTDGSDDAAGGPGEDTGEDDGATGPKVALPEGQIVEPETGVAEAVPTQPPDTAGERAGSVLKAERVVL